MPVGSHARTWASTTAGMADRPPPGRRRGRNRPVRVRRVASRRPAGGVTHYINVFAVDLDRAKWYMAPGARGDTVASFAEDLTAHGDGVPSGEVCIDMATQQAGVQGHLPGPDHLRQARLLNQAVDQVRRAGPAGGTEADALPVVKSGGLTVGQQTAGQPGDRRLNLKTARVRLRESFQDFYDQPRMGRRVQAVVFLGPQPAPLVTWRGRFGRSTRTASCAGFKRG